jgi:hypothetical protein
MAHGGVGQGGATAQAGSAGHSQGGASSTSDAGSLVCEVAPEDGDCMLCQKQHCCAVWTDCTRHEPCTCVSECLAAGVTVQDCEAHCETTAFPELDALTGCATDQCHDACN